MIDLSAVDQTPSQNPPVRDDASRSRVAAQGDNFPVAPNLQYGAILGGAGPQRGNIRVRQDDMDQMGLQAGSPRSSSMAPSLLRRRPQAETNGVIARLAQVRTRKENEKRDAEALCWLVDNRRKYSGQWVALQFSQLLAVGTTAKEVYSQIAGHQPPPLVTKVESENLPFGGW